MTANSAATIAATVCAAMATSRFAIARRYQIPMNKCGSAIVTHADAAIAQIAVTQFIGTGLESR